MYLITQRILSVLFGIPFTRWPLLRPLLNGLEIAARMHNASRGHVGTILCVPLVWNRCDVHRTHQALSQLIDTVVDMNHVEMKVLRLSIVCDVPVDLLPQFVLHGRQSAIVLKNTWETTGSSPDSAIDGKRRALQYSSLHRPSGLFDSSVDVLLPW